MQTSSHPNTKLTAKQVSFVQRLLIVDAIYMCGLLVLGTHLMPVLAFWLQFAIHIFLQNLWNVSGIALVPGWQSNAPARVDRHFCGAMICRYVTISNISAVVSSLRILIPILTFCQSEQRLYCTFKFLSKILIRMSAKSFCSYCVFLSFCCPVVYFLLEIFEWTSFPLPSGAPLLWIPQQTGLQLFLLLKIVLDLSHQVAFCD